MRLVLALLAAGVLAATASAAAVPRVEHTSAGMKAASSSLLHMADLGTGWTATPATSNVGVRVNCAGFRPKQSDLVEAGSAESPSFKRGAVGPYVVQRTSVYATPAHAKTFWDRAVKPAVLNCLVADLRRGFARQGGSIAVTSQQPLSLAGLRDRAAAYRVVTTVVTKTNRLKLYYDVVLIGKGRSVTLLTLTQWQAPIDDELEQRLSRAAARRLPSGAG
jgi:hypothetical protein